MIEHSILHWITAYGYAAIILLLMLGIAGLPVPDETLLIFTGYLIFKKHLHWIPALLAAFVGSSCGITLSYVLGRTFGLRLIHRLGPYAGITEERLNRTHKWLEHRGAWSLTIGYFFPGIRHVTAYVAGTSEMSPALFAPFAYGGALLWSATFVTVGYSMGDEWEKLSSAFHSYMGILTAVLIGVILAVVGVRALLGRKRSASAR